MKQLWKKFDKLTEICYMSELEDNCPQWDEAYEVFKQLVAQGREKDPQYAAEILKMDDATDFAASLLHNRHISKADDKPARFCHSADTHALS